MRASRSIVAALAAALVLGIGVAPAAYAATDGVSGSDIAAIRAATAKFQVADEAQLAAAGYVLKLPDGDGVTYCIDSAAGGMGIHYVNPAALAPGFDPAQPEVLVYEPGTNGKMHLVALEFVVFAADVPAGEHPAFLGRNLEYEPGPGEAGANRYGLPAFYALHVWAWKNNPSGMFADYNPKVHCPDGV